jgi:hypothetical protein
VLCLLVLWTFSVSFLPAATLTGNQARSNHVCVKSATEMNEDYFVVGTWLKAHLPATTRIAVNAAGIVPFVSGLPTVDMLGLNDAHVARRALSASARGSIAGHEKHDADHVLSLRPDLIFLGFPVLYRRSFHPDEVKAWPNDWIFLLPGDRRMLAHPRFIREYRLVSVRVRQGCWLVFFARLDGRFFTGDAATPPVQANAYSGYLPHSIERRPASIFTCVPGPNGSGIY